MKVAILCESPADEVTIRILAEAVLGIKISPVPHAGLRTRGWPSVRKVFSAVLKQLHYRSDAEGLICVVDSNASPVHEPIHKQPGRADPNAGCASFVASGTKCLPKSDHVRRCQDSKRQSDWPFRLSRRGCCAVLTCTSAKRRGLQGSSPEDCPTQRKTLNRSCTTPPDHRCSSRRSA